MKKLETKIEMTSGVYTGRTFVAWQGMRLQQFCDINHLAKNNQAKNLWKYCNTQHGRGLVTTAKANGGGVLSTSESKVALIEGRFRETCNLRLDLGDTQDREAAHAIVRDKKRTLTTAAEAIQEGFEEQFDREPKRAADAAEKAAQEAAAEEAKSKATAKAKKPATAKK